MFRTYNIKELYFFRDLYKFGYWLDIFFQNNPFAGIYSYNNHMDGSDQWHIDTDTMYNIYKLMILIRIFFFLHGYAMTMLYWTVWSIVITCTLQGWHEIIYLWPSKHYLLMSGLWLWWICDVCATVMYVPGIVYVCYSTVDINWQELYLMCMDWQVTTYEYMASKMFCISWLYGW